MDQIAVNMILQCSNVVHVFIFVHKFLPHVSLCLCELQLCTDINLAPDLTTSSQEPDLPLPEHRTRPSAPDKSIEINYELT
jgi:hypothetical protein